MCANVVCVSLSGIFDVENRKIGAVKFARLSIHYQIASYICTEIDPSSFDRVRRITIQLLEHAILLTFGQRCMNI